VAELEPAPQQGVVLCNQQEAMCFCHEPHAHTSPHICPCGGSWSYDEDGTFHIHAWPTALPPTSILFGGNNSG